MCKLAVPDTQLQTALLATVVHRLSDTGVINSLRNSQGLVNMENQFIDQIACVRGIRCVSYEEWRGMVNALINELAIEAWCSKPGPCRGGKPVFYYPGDIVISDNRNIALTNLEYFYLVVPSC